MSILPPGSWVKRLRSRPRAQQQPSTPQKIAIGSLLMLLILSTSACDELNSRVDGAKPLIQTGSCWSRGEGFREVTDGKGNSYSVEPFQSQFIGYVTQGGENLWLCGVSRSITPATVDGEWDTWEWSINEDTRSPGFYMPSGERVFVNPVELSQKFWQLIPAEWIH